MPIFKYKTFEEAKRALWCKEPDRAYFMQLNSLWALADSLNPCKYPSGVFKFRAIEEANKHRREWELAKAREMVERDSGSKGTERGS